MNDGMNQTPGKGLAIASMILGIIGLVVSVTEIFSVGVTGPLALVIGIVGVILAAVAKSHGNVSGIRTGGFIMSLLSLIFGAVGFVACLACGAASFAAASCLPLAFLDML